MTNDEIVKLAVAKAYQLGIQVTPVLPVVEGPRLLYFGLTPVGSTSVSRVEALASDFAVALHVEDVLVKRMPGQGVVGVFVPRAEPTILRWQALMARPEALNHGFAIPLLLGVDWQGRVFMDDLAKCPHLLIAGSTGGGKSVLLRSLAATIVHSVNSNAVKLVLSDTKGVEFTDLVAAPNLLYERATNPMRTIEYLDELCKETDARLRIFGELGYRNIQEYNEANPTSPTPYIVVMIDELADIVYLPSNKRGTQYIGAEKLDYISRKSRAAGIHCIAAVQRPSVDVVAGVIKNNFPARLSFRMASAVDSRVVLDTEGAEHLLGVGDCLYKSPNMPGLHRVHTGIASTKDIQAVLQFVNFKHEQARLNQ